MHNMLPPHQGNSSKSMISSGVSKTVFWRSSPLTFLMIISITWEAFNETNFQPHNLEQICEGYGKNPGFTTEQVVR